MTRGFLCRLLGTPLARGTARVRWRRWRSGSGATSPPKRRGQRDPVIGCRLLQQPFFLTRPEWFRVPDTFPVNAVSGKSLVAEEAEGAYLMRALEERLPWGALSRDEPLAAFAEGVAEGPRRGAPQIVMPRLGQGSFRVAVMDGFGRRCAVTGERTLPILDAAHIKPWNEGGENRPGNGLLLRTDIHRLFDLGYVTVSPDHHFEVSPRLREDYENGRAYYELHGRALRDPVDRAFLPSPTALAWHHANRWSRPGAVVR
jgi:putative restriction endonuclease